MNYTKGPWKAVCRSVNNPTNSAHWSESEFLQFEVEGPKVPTGRGEYYAADAFLIAAAPELLEALISMVGRFGGSSQGPLDTLAINVARAAIAKAEGL